MEPMASVSTWLLDGDAWNLLSWGIMSVCSDSISSVPCPLLCQLSFPPVLTSPITSPVIRAPSLSGLELVLSPLTSLTIWISFLWLPQTIINRMVLNRNLLTVLESRSQNQDVHRAVLSLKTLGKSPSLALPSCWWLLVTGEVLYL
jgi:hypothetical protein